MELGDLVEPEDLVVVAVDPVGPSMTPRSRAGTISPPGMVTALMPSLPYTSAPMP
jgi:hypothetical protein